MLFYISEYISPESFGESIEFSISVLLLWLAYSLCYNLLLRWILTYKVNQLRVYPAKYQSGVDFRESREHITSNASLGHISSSSDCWQTRLQLFLSLLPPYACSRTSKYYSPLSSLDEASHHRKGVCRAETDV